MLGFGRFRIRLRLTVLAGFLLSSSETSDATGEAMLERSTSSGDPTRGGPVAKAIGNLGFDTDLRLLQVVG